MSVLLEAFFILSLTLTDFSFTFEIQYDSLLLTHDPTYKANLVLRFFFPSEGLVLAAEKAWKRGWYKARKDPNFRKIIPSITFSKLRKDRNVELQ